VICILGAVRYIEGIALLQNDALFFTLGDISDKCLRNVFGRGHVKSVATTIPSSQKYG
jgi:hypothetical protein